MGACETLGRGAGADIAGERLIGAGDGDGEGERLIGAGEYDRSGARLIGPGVERTGGVYCGAL